MLDMFSESKKLKRKRANSETKAASIAKKQITMHSEEIVHILEQNKKLEDQISELRDNSLTKENIELRRELSNVRHKLSE